MADSLPCGPSILVVEAQAVRRDFLLMVLGRLRYVVEVAGSGAEALRRLDLARPGLVLLDRLLPDSDGAALVQRIRGSGRAWADVPIIVFGLGDDVAQAEACRLAGAQELLRQPLAIDRLLGAIRRLTRQRSQAAMTAPSEPVVDLVHLGGFTTGDAALEREIAELFLASADDCVARLDQSLAGPTPDAWSRAAHALKGAAANLGARSLAREAGAAERDQPNEAALAAIRSEVERVAGFLRARLG